MTRRHVPQHQESFTSGGGGPGAEQQPPFLTLEETTTADTSNNSDSNSNLAPQPSSSSSPSQVPDPSSGPVDYSEAEDDENDKKKKKFKNKPISAVSDSKKKKSSVFSVKKLISYSMFSLIALIIWDAMFTPPEKRWIQIDKTDVFLLWVQNHPVAGLFAITLVIAAAVVVLIPIGTPLTLGCGYIYKGAYGWKLGLALATVVSMGGSALGAVICFLLGRYLFREQVREVARNKYPLFDAIDTAASEHGLRIMAMLYLTPILPLGPVSYMCGTTSMRLSSFILAKIASLPLMLLYCFIGASTRTLLSQSRPGEDNKASNPEMKSIQENETLIALGILMSFVMIAGITTYIRKELNKILERQQKHKPGEKENRDLPTSISSPVVDEEQPSVEMGTITTARRRGA